MSSSEGMTFRLEGVRTPLSSSAAICLRMQYDASSTEVAYGAMPGAVLTSCMALSRGVYGATLLLCIAQY
eukprot:1469650-Rhodomonas_salina.2